MKDFLSRFGYNFKIALEAISQNKLRALLTSLGIICGVASVISMLAIGKGAEQEILEKMKLLGTNNIIIEPIQISEMLDNDNNKEEEDSDDTEQSKSSKNKFSPGLSLSDMNAIRDIVPNINYVNPEITIEKNAYFKRRKFKSNLVGTGINFLKVNNFSITKGRNFSEFDMKNSLPVCIIGSGVKKELFPMEDPIGKKLKCGSIWLEVIGIMEKTILTDDNISSLGIRDFNTDIYSPYTTVLLRYANRSLVTKEDLEQRRRRRSNSVSSIINIHQLDKIIVSIADTEQSKQMAIIIEKMLKRRHNGIEDFKVIVPELLLAQEQSTKRIFNIVLGAIASISLIVGGIGIMNIMLASVLERTKEIGVRKAVGGKRFDILLQFLSEAVTISLSGGIVGIILGVGGSYLIEALTDINTIVSASAVLISFFVSITVGLVFGITPARRASKQDPIELLRYE